MTAGATYVPIATQTLGTAAATVTFSSIPGTYTDLELVVSYQGTSTGANLYPNGDGTANKSYTGLRGNGTTADSNRASNSVAIQDYVTTSTNASGEFTVSKFYVFNYANTTTYKTVLVKKSEASAYVEALVGTHRITTAITSLQVSSASGNFAVGSTFTLYGIAAA